MQKNTNKSFTFYLLIFGLFALLRSNFQSMMSGDGPDDSQIRSYFVAEQVEYFTLKDGSLNLQLKSEGEEKEYVSYELADPEGFMADMRPLINEQLDSGVLTGYKHLPGMENSALYQWMPTLISLGMCAFLFFTIFRQRSGGSGGPGANFGQAKTRTFTGGENSVTFRDVAGADEEKAEMRSLTDGCVAAGHDGEITARRIYDAYKGGGMEAARAEAAAIAATNPDTGEVAMLADEDIEF